MRSDVQQKGSDKISREALNRQKGFEISTLAVKLIRYFIDERELL